MAQPFLSQIEAFPFNFAPKGWAFCAGQLMPINQNQALFALLGTTFGGDGVRTFALPDLRGRLANGFGQGAGLANYPLGQRGGEEAHTLTTAETPTHSHLINADSNGTTGGASTPGGGSSWARAMRTKRARPRLTSTVPRPRRSRWGRLDPRAESRTKTACRSWR